MAILDNYASDFVGPAALPRPRSVFTPAAYAQASSIADRARLASQNLQKSLEFADSESKMRDFILKGQEQDSTAAKLYYEAETRAMQPALKQELNDIDPLDDDALDKIASIEQSVTSPETRRSLASKRYAANAMLRDQKNLVEDMVKAGYDAETISKTLESGKQLVRGGDPMGLAKAGAGLLASKTGTGAGNLGKAQESFLRAARNAGVPFEEAQAKLAKATEEFNAGDATAFAKEAYPFTSFNERQAAMRMQTQPLRQAEVDVDRAKDALGATGFGREAAQVEPNLRNGLTRLKAKYPSLDVDNLLNNPNDFQASEDMDEQTFDVLKRYVTAARELKNLKDVEQQRNRMKVLATETGGQLPGYIGAVPSNNGVALSPGQEYLARILGQP
jgi:hypothetical protein